MTALEEALAALDDARPPLPDDLASPTSEAALALLEEILSLPTATQEPEVVEPESAPRRCRRRLVLVAAASVVALAAAAFAAAQLSSDENDDTILILPVETPDRSGRLTITMDSDWEMVDEPTHLVSTTEWSGDDLRNTAPGPVELRLVDGRAWVLDATPTYDANGELVESPPPGWGETATLGLDSEDYEPPTFDSLGEAAFTPVGDEEVTGVPAQRRRAVDPAAVLIDVFDRDSYFAEGVLTQVEVWVDDAGIVRRADLTWTGSSQGKPFVETHSLVWSDLGEPITIERPPVD